MYEAFFGLREAPFSLTPDTDYFFGYRAHEQALEVLLHAVRHGEGFIKITGEVGTGKTLLCRKLLGSLDDHCVTAFIPNPALSPEGLRQALARELRLKTEGLDSHLLLDAIQQRLVRLARERKRVVLCIDEAQTLSNDGLEAVRLLTNLETQKIKLLQVILFAQPELDQRLRTPELRQLQQRISFDYQLEPFDRAAVDSYVAHRLTVAGYNGERLFNRGAIRRLHRCSGGIPRLINVIAHKALMVAYGKGRRRVGRGEIQQAADDTAGAFVAGGRRWLVWGVALPGLALASAAAVAVYGGVWP
jgi:MSHA biogenesis protein MshM